MVTLQSVYRHPEIAIPLLYQLLSERTPEQSISHKEMPSLKDHQAFFDSKPYQCWYLIFADDRPVGAIYLSKQREIGVGILKEYVRQGYGRAAVEALMAKWPGRFLANINEKNEHSLKMFRSIGFKTLQITLTL